VVHNTANNAPAINEITYMMLKRILKNRPGF